MITISVSDYNQFSQDYYDSVINSLQLHRLKCSCGHCACLSIHAYYCRSVFLPDSILSLRVCRVRCSECGRTHALLLSSIVPYCRISLSRQVVVVQAFEDCSSPGSLCDDDMFDENNVKSVILRYRRFWRERLRSERIPLLPLPDLILACFAIYSMQFMQIHRGINILFAGTT